jgi:predicted NAD-dependent protein-ADP-ribosyltransferase YbiA (DUF1768 family)
MQWVPFTVVLSAGFECRGMIYDDADHFRFEYQLVNTKDTTAHKAHVKHLRIPVSNIQSVNLVKGWQGQQWSGVKLVIEANSADFFEDFPAIKQNRIELGVSKANVPLAEAFVQELYSTLASSV